MVPTGKPSPVQPLLLGENHLAIDPSAHHGNGIPTRLDASKLRQAAWLVNGLVLKGLIRPVGCEADSSKPSRYCCFMHARSVLCVVLRPVRASGEWERETRDSLLQTKQVNGEGRAVSRA